jgi:hypothetical protein
MNEENKPLTEKLNQTLKKFEGIAEVFSGVLRPPDGLPPEKGGVFVCLGIGTLGIVALSYIGAPWYAFVADVALAIVIAILFELQSKR